MWSINSNKGEMCGAEVSRTVHVHVQRSRQIYAGKYQSVTHNPHNNRKFEAFSCVPYVVRYHYRLQYPFSCGYFERLSYWKIWFITTAYAERIRVWSPPAMILINQSIAYGGHTLMKLGTCIYEESIHLVHSSPEINEIDFNRSISSCSILERMKSIRPFPN